MQQNIARQAVASLFAAVEAELASEAAARYSPGESGSSPAVRLREAQSWPRKSSRRVLEATPPGGGQAHWAALQCPSGGLRAALDAILGPGAWELPPNAPPGCSKVAEAQEAPSGGSRGGGYRAALVLEEEEEEERGGRRRLRGDLAEEEAPAARTAAGEAIVRHWYCPVAFPEDPPAEERAEAASGSKEGAEAVWAAAEDALLRKAVGPGGKAKRPAWAEIAAAVPGRSVKECKERWGELLPWSPAEDAVLLRAYEQLGPAWTQLQKLPELQPAERTKRGAQRRLEVLCQGRPAVSECSNEREGLPAMSWTAVSRRRVRGKGWHVDIGPGFDTAWTRRSTGHRFQGCVVLVLLSDCPPGGGGTAFAVGSHVWVQEFLQEREVSGFVDGVPHEELNRWAMEELKRRQAEGRLRYDYDPAPAESRIEQLVGSAGDVWLMHPFLVHSGTTNLTGRPRVLANGMARVCAQTWAEVGHPLLAKVPYQSSNNGFRCRTLDEGYATMLKRVGGTLRTIQSDLTGTPDSRHASSAMPLVSVIVPVHNANRTSLLVGDMFSDGPPSGEVACTWLDDCFGSILRQTYQGPLEVSAYDDASNDGSEEVLRQWVRRFKAAGIQMIVNGSRWPECGGDASASSRGIGFCRNRAIRQSSGEFLCLLDADDVMLPERIELQLEAAVQHPHALLGAGMLRFPQDATKHYMEWANTLEPAELWLQQYRECTLLCPSWFLRRSLFEAVAGFEEAQGDPRSGEGEDLTFFLRHLELFEARGQPLTRLPVAGSSEVPLVRVGCSLAPLVCYRYTPGSASSRCSRRRLVTIRTFFFERRVIWGGAAVGACGHPQGSAGPAKQGWAASGFSVWGAGRDARDFLRALSPAALRCVRMLIDLDPGLCGSVYCDHSRPPEEPCAIPIVHFRDASAGRPCPPGPVVVCVSLRASEKRRWDDGSAVLPGNDHDDLRANVATLGLTEGQDLWFFN